MKEIHFNKFMDLSKRQGKVLICGEEGAGKTLLSTYIGIEKMLMGVQDCWKSYERVDRYNDLGYNFSKNYEHLVFSNFDINCLYTHIPSFKSYVVDPYKVGFHCKDYETTPLPPYSFLILTEAQSIFNAYLWNYFRPEVRRYWETSRQTEVEIIIDTNSPNLIYKGMRELLNRIIYLYAPVEEIKDKNGIVIGHKLYAKEFKKYNQLEKYFETNNEKLVKEEYVLILNRCVYPNYNTKQCEYLALKGREMDDYIIEHFPEIKTVEDVETFVSNFGLYMPEGYLIKSSDFLKKKQSENDEFDDFKEICV